jgi:hypothetical protein
MFLTAMRNMMAMLGLSVTLAEEDYKHKHWFNGRHAKSTYFRNLQVWLKF